MKLILKVNKISNKRYLSQYHIILKKKNIWIKLNQNLIFDTFVLEPLYTDVAIDSGS